MKSSPCGIGNPLSSKSCAVQYLVSHIAFSNGCNLIFVAHSLILLFAHVSFSFSCTCFHSFLNVFKHAANNASVCTSVTIVCVLFLFFCFLLWLARFLFLWSSDSDSCESSPSCSCLSPPSCSCFSPPSSYSLPSSLSFLIPLPCTFLSPSSLPFSASSGAATDTDLPLLTTDSSLFCSVLRASFTSTSMTGPSLGGGFKSNAA